MVILAVALAADALLVLLTLFWIRSKAYKTDEKVLAVTGESPVTAVLSVFCLVVSFFLLYAKFSDPSVAGDNPGSWWFIGGLSVASALLGCYNLLYIFVRKYMVFPDRLVTVNVLGDSSEFYWGDIQSVSVPMMSRSLRIKSPHGTCHIRSGNSREYRKFVGILKDYIPRAGGRDQVENLYNSM